MQPVAKTQANNLISRLNELAILLPIPEFTLARFQVEAEKIRKVDPSGGDQILGIIAGLKGDYRDMHRCHQNAIQLEPSDPNTYNNYASSLAKSCFHNKGVEFAVKAYEMAPDNISFLYKIILYLFQAGRPEMALSYIKKFKKLAPNKDISKDVDNILSLATIMNTAEIPEDDTAEMSNAVASLLHKNNHFHFIRGHDVVPGERFIWTYTLYCSLEEIIDLEEEWEDVVAQSVSLSKVSHHVNVQFIPENETLNNFFELADRDIEMSKDNIVEIDENKLKEIEALLE